MAARRVYRFDYIAPNSGAGVFIHGYGNQETVSYSAVVYAGFGAGVWNPLGHATLSEGEVFRHVDGTVARRLHVQNNAPFNSCTVDINQTTERF